MSGIVATHKKDPTVELNPMSNKRTNSGERPGVEPAGAAGAVASYKNWVDAIAKRSAMTQRKRSGGLRWRCVFMVRSCRLALFRPPYISFLSNIQTPADNNKII